MRILICSYHFPPHNTIGAVRVGKTAKYLVKHGHYVQVLTAAKIPLVGNSLPVEVPFECIRQTRCLPLNITSQLGTDSAPPSQDTSSPYAAVEASKRVLFLSTRWVFRHAIWLPDPYFGWFPFAAKALRSLVRRFDFDLVLASSPPPTALIACATALRGTHVPWVADMRDLWSDNLLRGRSPWQLAVDRRVEAATLAGAAAFVTASEPLARVLVNRYAKPTAVVYNGYDPGDFPRRPAKRTPGPLKITYTGTVYHGSQDPSALFAAVRRLRVGPDVLTIDFYGQQMHPVAELAERYGVSRVVRAHGPVTYPESLRLQTESDVLLLLSGSQVNLRAAPTGKLFEYIGARRPVLVIGPSDSEASRLVAGGGYGVTESSEDGIEHCISAWVKEKQTTMAVSQPPASTAEEFTRENQTRRLEQFLASLVPGRSR